MRRYTNIALPNDLVEKIDIAIKKSNLGYRSKAELVKEAVRNSLKSLKVI